MTRDELIALAKEAGFVPNYGIAPLPIMDYATVGLDPTLERFATLVAAKEREACALVCETHAPKGLQHGLSYAAAIRSRKP